MKLEYATACLDADEQRRQTDARVRGPARALEWAGKSGLVSCVRGRPGPGNGLRQEASPSAVTRPHSGDEASPAPALRSPPCPQASGQPLLKSASAGLQALGTGRVWTSSRGGGLPCLWTRSRLDTAFSFPSETAWEGGCGAYRWGVNLILGDF